MISQDAAVLNISRNTGKMCCVIEASGASEPWWYWGHSKSNHFLSWRQENGNKMAANGFFSFFIWSLALGAHATSDAGLCILVYPLQEEHDRHTPSCPFPSPRFLRAKTHGVSDSREQECASLKKKKKTHSVQFIYVSVPFPMKMVSRRSSCYHRVSASLIHSALCCGESHRNNIRKVSTGICPRASQHKVQKKKHRPCISIGQVQSRTEQRFFTHHQSVRALSISASQNTLSHCLLLSNLLCSQRYLTNVILPTA